MHSCVISSEFFCVHKSTYWNVVNTSVHQQFYCVSCGGINNLVWIFSLHFNIRLNCLNPYRPVGLEKSHTDLDCFLC